HVGALLYGLTGRRYRLAWDRSAAIETGRRRAMTKHTKTPTHPTRPVKAIVDLATSDADVFPGDEEESAVIAVRRGGGKVGGAARAKKLSAKQRSDIARDAAQARWRASHGSS